MAKLSLICSVLLPLLLHYGSGEHAGWVEADVWSRDIEAKRIRVASEGSTGEASRADSSHCPTPAHGPDVSLFLYRRLINMLFARRNMLCLDEEGKCERVVQFSVLIGELESLEQLRDIRDADAVLTKIFERSKTLNIDTASGLRVALCNAYFAIKSVIMDSIACYVHYIKLSEVQFTLGAILVFIIGYYAKNRYRIAALTLALCSVFLFGYYVTYLECNRKLALERVERDIREYEEQQVTRNYAWYNIFAYLTPQPTAAELYLAKLRRSVKIDLPFCRPETVLMMYSNQFLFQYFNIVIEGYAAACDKLQDLPLALKILSPIVLVCMYAYFVKLFFRYIFTPAAWAPYLFTTSRPEALCSSCTATLSTVPSVSSSEDRLSGENLKSFLRIQQAAYTLIVKDRKDTSVAATNTEAITLYRPSEVEELHGDSEHDGSSEVSVFEQTVEIGEHANTTKIGDLCKLFLPFDDVIYLPKIETTNPELVDLSENEEDEPSDTLDCTNLPQSTGTTGPVAATVPIEESDASMLENCSDDDEDVEEEDDGGEEDEDEESSSDDDNTNIGGSNNNSINYALAHGFDLLKDCEFD